MAKDVKMYTCMICSAMDEKTKKIRNICRDVIYHWNEMNSAARGICFIAIGQENAVPDVDRTPQYVIDKQILERSDIGIVIFKNKRGSPYKDPKTGVTYESGTEYELEQFMQSEKIPRVYIKNQKRLSEIKERIGKKVYYDQYKNENEFRGKIKDLIDHLANEYLATQKIDKDFTESVLYQIFLSEKERQPIFDYLKSNPNSSNMDISKGLNLHPNTIRSNLNDMAVADMIKKEKVKSIFVYSIKDLDFSQ